MKDQVIASVVGVGIGSLKEHFMAVVAAKVPIYVSRLSSDGRGVTKKDLEGKNGTFALPSKLVELATQSDTALTY